MDEEAKKAKDRQARIRAQEARCSELKDRLLHCKGSLETVSVLQRSIAELEAQNAQFLKEMQVP